MGRGGQIPWTPQVLSADPCQSKQTTYPRTANCLCRGRCSTKPRNTLGSAAPARGTASPPGLRTNLLLRTAPEGLQAGEKPRQVPLCLTAQWLLSCGPPTAWKQHHSRQCPIVPSTLEAVLVLSPGIANEPNQALTKGCTQWVMSCHLV